MTPGQFLSRLKRGEVPAVSLLLGSESYERRRCREALIAAHLTEEERAQIEALGGRYALLRSPEEFEDLLRELA